MAHPLNRLIEARIKGAEASGDLSGLAGEGTPLPDRSGEAHLDAATQVAHRIMAENGAVPQEFALKKALDTARAAYRDAPDGADRKALMADIAKAELAYNTAVDARRKFMKG